MAVRRLKNTYVINSNAAYQEQQKQFGRQSVTLGKGRIRGKNGENIAQYNFKSIAKVGLGIRTYRMGNEVVGSYTNNRVRQRRNQGRMTMMQYGIAIGITGKFGIVYSIADFGYRSMMYAIEADHETREAERLRRLSGNIAVKNKKFDGVKL